jgi:hypothetical protein
MSAYEAGLVEGMEKAAVSLEAAKGLVEGRASQVRSAISEGESLRAKGKPIRAFMKLKGIADKTDKLDRSSARLHSWMRSGPGQTAIQKHLAKKSAANLTAVIVMGNPKYVRGNKQADRSRAELTGWSSHRRARRPSRSAARWRAPSTTRQTSRPRTKRRAPSTTCSRRR